MEDIKVIQPSDGNKFYMCTVVIDAENPDNGKPKKMKEIHLVESVSPQFTGGSFHTGSPFSHWRLCAGEACNAQRDFAATFAGKLIHVILQAASALAASAHPSHLLQ